MVPAILLVVLATIVPPVTGQASAGEALRPRAAAASPVVVGAGAATSGTRAWTWPLAPVPPVAVRFEAPPTPWSAGHRGVDLLAGVGQPVLAAGRGQVTFAGMVAGRGVVVVRHAGGWRTTYEPVDERAASGTLVDAGTPIGVVSATPGHCAPAICLHWGLRQAQTYVDPLQLVGRGPPVLLPLSPR